MTESEAKLYLLAMADGIDPMTGEILPDDHLLREDPIREALLLAAHLLSSEPRDPRGRKNGKLNAGRPWTKQDDTELLRLTAAGFSPEEIAKQLQRRVRGINNRLAALQPDKKPASRHGQPWTPAENARLLSLIAEHLPL